MKLALTSPLVFEIVNYNQRKINSFLLVGTQSSFAANITNLWQCETPGPKIASLVRRSDPAQIYSQFRRYGSLLFVARSNEAL